MPAPPGVSADRLNRALGVLWEHHDAVRSRFRRTVSGTWEQTFAGVDDPIQPLIVDVSKIPAEERTAFIEARAAELQPTLNLERGPLLRIVWFQRGDQTDLLFVMIHHLLMDHVSRMVLLEDLMDALRQLRAGQDVQLPPKTHSFRQWATLLRDIAQSEIARKESAYWLDARRRGISPLPRDHPQGINSRAGEETLNLNFSAENTDALRRLGRSLHATVDDILLAALGSAVSRWTGTNRVLVNIERHGRDDLGVGLNTSRTVGWFANISPLLLDLPAEASAAELLLGVRRQIQEVPNRGIGYGLLRYLGDRASRAELRKQPEPEVFFCYHGEQRGPATRPERANPAEALAVGPLRGRQGGRRHLIEVNAMIRDGELRVRCAYSAKIHERRTLERLGHEFETCLLELLAIPAPDEGNAL